VELRLENGPTMFGAAIDSNIVTASFKAVLSAVNRQLAQKEAAAAPAKQVAA
jgi:2-isopropylmalate synthase